MKNRDQAVDDGDQPNEIGLSIGGSGPPFELPTRPWASTALGSNPNRRVLTLRVTTRELTRRSPPFSFRVCCAQVRPVLPAHAIWYQSHTDDENLSPSDPSFIARACVDMEIKPLVSVLGITKRRARGHRIVEVGPLVAGVTWYLVRQADPCGDRDEHQIQV